MTKLTSPSFPMGLPTRTESQARLGILPKTEYRPEHYRFQREQSRETKAATWEDRPDAPEPWWRIVGAASGYVALAYATWRMLPFLAAVVRAL
jgi:hypothetical protein